MPAKLEMRERIVESAWELFYEKGYDETTIQDILDRAGIARGSFYYHFKGKDVLLNTLSDLLDNYYKELDGNLADSDMTAYEKLLYLNYMSHSFIEKKIHYTLIARLYALQLTKPEGSTLLCQDRYYYGLILRIVQEGQKEGSVTAQMNAQEIVEYYSMCERALVTDWCMNEGRYSLGEISRSKFEHMFAFCEAK